MIESALAHTLARPPQHRLTEIDSHDSIYGLVGGQRNAGADADLENVPATGRASLLSRGNGRAPARRENRAEHQIVDGRPQRISARDASLIEIRPHDESSGSAASSSCHSLLDTLSPCRHSVGRIRTFDKAAAEHAGLTLAGIVEHTSLTRRYAMLARGEVHFISQRAIAQPRRLRRARRAHLHEDFAPIIGKRLVNRAVTDPVHVA